MERIRHFLEEESGSSAVEYGLLVALIGLACIAAIRMLGINLVDVFTKVTSAISGGS